MSGSLLPMLRAFGQQHKVGEVRMSSSLLSVLGNFEVSLSFESIPVELG